MQLRQQLKAYSPDSVIADETNSRQSLGHDLNETAVIDFGLSEEFMRPLHPLKSFEPDPMIGIFGTPESLEDHELGIFQALFQGRIPKFLRRGDWRLGEGNGGIDLGRFC